MLEHPGGPLPSDPRWDGGCRGVGADLVIHGSATDPRVTRATGEDGDRRFEILWPVGYSARFVPGLQVLDASGTVVAREGDRLTGACGAGETPSGQPIWVEGRDVQPALPST
jgi:hypothetical protein